MINNSLIIDGVDVYTNFGVYVVKGGWNELVSFPPLKSVDYNDWHEYDGIEVDLSNPVLDARELNLKFASCGNYSSFVNMLLDETYRQFVCSEIGREVSLRYVQQANLAKASSLYTFALKFSDDFPLDRTTHERLAPVSNIASSADWKLDNINLTSYGVRVLDGSLAELLKTPAVKKNLCRNISTRSGIIYDDVPCSFQSRDVRLSCLMTASNLTNFWVNHDTLLFDLIQPDERKLTSFGGQYKCYYKSCAVSEFIPSGNPWMKFTLTLCITK